MKKKALLIGVLSACMLFAACGKDNEAKKNDNSSVSISVSNETEVSASVEQIEVEPEPEPEPEPEAIVVGDFVISGDRLTASGGYYEQDGNEANGPEKVEWIVLEDNGDSMLLLSKNVLDCVPYGKSYDSVSWDKSNVRSFLNDSFYNSVFSGEQMAIIEDYVTVWDYVEVTPATTSEESAEAVASEPEKEAVPVLSDKVFLLSLEEVEKYLGENIDGTSETRSAQVTAYAASNGVYFVNEENYKLFGYEADGLGTEVIGAGNWWLRDNGGKDTEAMDVGATGIIRRTGHDVGSKKDGIRPAIMIKISE